MECVIEDFYYLGKLNNLTKRLKWSMGVYILYNNSNGKYYVGASKRLYDRLHEHNDLRMFDIDSINDDIDVYLFQTTNNKKSLRFTEYTAINFILSNGVSKKYLYNKRLTPNYAYNFDSKTFYEDIDKKIFSTICDGFNDFLTEDKVKLIDISSQEYTNIRNRKKAEATNRDQRN